MTQESRLVYLFKYVCSESVIHVCLPAGSNGLPSTSLIGVWMGNILFILKHVYLAFLSTQGTNLAYISLKPIQYTMQHIVLYTRKIVG